MADRWRIFSIDGIPFGWARVSEANRNIVKELCIHETHISYNEGYTSRIVDADPSRVALEPTEPGFYKIEGDTFRVFLKSPQTGQWTLHHSDGHTRMVTWGEIDDRCGDRNFVKT